MRAHVRYELLEKKGHVILAQMGQFYVAVYIYLLSDEPDPIKAWPPSVTLGTGLGHFKVQDAAVPLGDVLPAFDGTRSGPGTLLKLLKPLRERAARQGAA